MADDGHVMGAHPHPTDNGGRPPRRILVTDRNPLTRRALADLLRATQRFAEVHHAPPPEAHRWAREMRADLVLLDVVRPLPLAVLHCRRLSALTPKPAILALTALPEAEEERTLRQAGVGDYLPKEVNIERLLQSMEALGPAGPYRPLSGPPAGGPVTDRPLSPTEVNDA